MFACACARVCLIGYISLYISVIMSGVRLSNFRLMPFVFHLFISLLVRLDSRFLDLVDFLNLLVRSPCCHCSPSHCRAVCRRVSLSLFLSQLDFEFIVVGLFFIRIVFHTLSWSSSRLRFQCLFVEFPVTFFHLL